MGRNAEKRAESFPVRVALGRGVTIDKGGRNRSI